MIGALNYEAIRDFTITVSREKIVEIYKKWEFLVVPRAENSVVVPTRA